MDPISYGVAAKQKQRIEKVIAEPDSTSGVITVPQVIATGETITVPAGRTAVLPNVQVDGELVVNGEVFIPSGSGLSTVVQKSGDTITGNLNFASGTRITGDFSNANIADRTLIQTSSLDSGTNVGIIPNGGGAYAGVAIYKSSDPSNTSYLHLTAASDGSNSIRSAKTGAGVYTPLTFLTGGAERMRIDTSGNVLVTGSGGLGYGTGSGGTVTQLTSKSTAVTLNKPCGQITMNNAALAANTAVKFTLTNSLISSSQDLLIVNVVSGVTGFENYNVWGACWGGAATITLKNISAGSLSEAVVLEFVIIKGAVS